MRAHSAAYAFATWIVFMSSSGLAQECVVVGTTSGGRHRVKIDDKELVTITEAECRKIPALTEEVHALREKLGQAQKVLEEYEKTVAKYEALLEHQKEYIVELESIRNGYKKLAEDWQRLGKDPIASFEVGLGATSEDLNPAIMVGVGLWRFRVWGFLQEKNPGVFVGTSLPLF